ncbi:uncharacterized protein LOC116303982 [Actinia tenebrosa]|uniref:Uncharacterized protein LOC116303982 n=1 Tax=Actinia tenebrosa TaxID=6105 RepID=A0A6P8IRA4_ACTTE|nr:uncharacterized protein LOC116303982 [Actinia tenebrosa]
MADTESIKRKHESKTLITEDKPLPMDSRVSDARKDYQKVYKRMCSENKDEQAAIWTSMFEENLGREVSGELPPWLGPKEKKEGKFGDPEKTDLATIHKARAKESGVANAANLIDSKAEQKEIKESPWLDQNAKSEGDSENQEKTDFESIHKERVIESGVANAANLIDERRHRARSFEGSKEIPPTTTGSDKEK